MEMKLIIISGLSGSGKSIALQTLEDEGFYCVDNLPLSFLSSFCDKFYNHPNIKKLAIGVDARGFPEELLIAHQFVDAIRNIYLDINVVFLQAADDILLKRYHETRRRHPLSNQQRGLLESIVYERALLESLMGQSNSIIDTSNLNVHELRQEIKERLLSSSNNGLSIQLESFGFKNGIPLNADFVFDARSLTNPHWDSNLRAHTGQEEPVQSYLDQATDVQMYLETLKKALDSWIPTFEIGTRSYLTLAIGCTGGKHRSVYLVERLNKYLLAQQKSVIVRHRELKTW
ncbi:nucleotide-binding protein [Gammaproteobacteria bacterium]|nr:nucleotide-binding protein [Gammaproteobacteria bacterium]